ncbi:hypothetical protein QBC39DRAFT_247896 [Podospora conica]|nr:hypothetical protein QBC39DRAFT_247896 [Schizothecium conicum]
MRLLAALGSATLFLAATPVTATQAHRRAHDQLRRHQHGHHAGSTNHTDELTKRGSSCSLPDHPDLVHVPGAKNGGFAMAGDIECKDGMYCPIACVSGKVMAQWKEGTKYTYPESMYGGLKCNNGVAEKPFADKPYCVDGTGAVKAVNKCGSVVSFCQTVLPGDEAMVIPTDVDDAKTLAVPGISYWAQTAAHYYINPPGVASGEGCVWGTPAKPVGNWSPYVAGANTVADGNTFVKIAWNPIYTGEGYAGVKPTFGVKIECPDGGCNGLPCGINPETDGFNGVSSPVKANGVGGANFCVVTVPKGKTANIVVYNLDGSSSGGSVKVAPSSTKEKEKEKPAPTSTSETSTSTTAPPTSSEASSTSVAKPSTSRGPKFIPGGIFHENSTYTETEEGSSTYGTTTRPSLGASSTASADAPKDTVLKSEAAAGQTSGAIAGLIVAFVAAAALF